MKKIGLAVLAVAALAAGTAYASTQRNYMGSACFFEIEQSGPGSHTRTGHRFVNTSGGARQVTCPAVADSDKKLWFASMDFKPPVTALRVEMRHWDGALLGWSPEREITVEGTTSQRRAQWFQDIQGSAQTAAAVAFEATVGDEAYILKYSLEQ